MFHVSLTKERDISHVSNPFGVIKKPTTLFGQVFFSMFLYTCSLFQNIQIAISIKNILVDNIPLKLIMGCKCPWQFINIRYKNEGSIVEKLPKKRKKNYFVLIRVFNVLGQIPTSTQALVHSCLPFPIFLSYVMHFCKSTGANLMETYFKVLHNFSLIMPYWYPLEKTWPKQVSWKLSYKPRIWQLTTDFNALVIALRLYPSSFTKTIISFRSYLSNKLVRLWTRACPIVFEVSNNPIVKCFSYQSFPKKLRTKANISYTPFDIHKLKLEVTFFQC